MHLNANNTTGTSQSSQQDSGMISARHNMAPSRNHRPPAPPKTETPPQPWLWSWLAQPWLWSWSTLLRLVGRGGNLWDHLCKATQRWPWKTSKSPTQNTNWNKLQPHNLSWCVLKLQTQGLKLRVKSQNLNYIKHHQTTNLQRKIEAVGY
jgi:hypothetical protein